MRIGTPRPGAWRAVGAVAAALGLMLGALLLPRSLRPPAPTTPEPEGAIPRLELTIAMRPMMLLRSLRDQALERGLLFRSDSDTVKAMIHHRGQRQKVRIRLKGDFVDHFKTEKWSWRVHVGGGGQVLGMRRFSLQAPNTRRHHWEALFLQHLRDEGVLAPRYEFVHLSLNKTEVGVMALEEHFSKELLEAQDRREGVLLRFDEDEFWRDRARNDAIKGVGKVSASDDFSWRDARVRPFRASAIAKSPALQRQARVAVGLMRALQEGTAEPSEVLDVETWGRLLAVSELWGYWHGLRWHNLRFYLNPITMHLEPVGFDATSKRPADGFLSLDRHLIFTKVLLADPAIHAAYRRHLARITEPKALQAQRERLDALAAPMVEALKPEYPRLPGSVSAHLRRRASKVLSPDAKFPSPARILRKARTGRGRGPIQGALPHTAAVYAQVVQDDEGAATLELFTGLKEDVQVTELFVRWLGRDRRLSGFTEVELPITLPASFFDTPTVPVRIPLPPELADKPELLGGTAIAPSDADRHYPIEAVAYEPVADAPVLPEAGTLAALLAEHPFLRWQDGAVVVPGGEHAVATPLIVPQRLQTPEGERLRPPLRVEPGTTLRFAEGAFVLTWGDLLAPGTAELPIVLTGEQPWRGLTVLGEGAVVSWSHVRVERTRSAELGPWALTGAVTLHQTRTTLDHVVFAGTQAEDALNLVRSTFVLRDVSFEDTRSDALDSDFSDGTMRRCSLARIGGDGVDLSGSVVSAHDLRAEDVHDKALSIGEASEFEADGLRVSGVGVAAVSKDASTVRLANVTATDVVTAVFMAYSKKPEYGPGHLEVTGASLQADTVPGVVQLGSSLLIEGKPIPPVDLDVDAMYSTGLMRK